MGMGRVVKLSKVKAKIVQINQKIKCFYGLL
jgi:hypothetical protein